MLRIPYIIVGLTGLIAGCLFAENQPSGGSGGNKPNPNSNILSVFDGNFFDAKRDEPARTLTPGGRALADDADYNTNSNTETRSQAMDRCAPLKNKDFAKYQQCYQNDMKKSKAVLQEKIDEVENKQKMPLNNAVNPLIEEQERKGASSEEND